MISDVLLKAREEIEMYQQEMPHVYDDLRDDIEHVKQVMEALRATLDNPMHPEYQYEPTAVDYNRLLRTAGYTCEVYEVFAAKEKKKEFQS